MSFKAWSTVWDEEQQERRGIDTARTCSFGITPLDDALVGILKNDLVIVGADSGVGKSEICLDMAVYNCANGKKVALYFIEGGAQEAIARMKWKLIRQKIYNARLDTDYRLWRLNKNVPGIGEIENETKIELEKKIKNNLGLYTFQNNFTVGMLQESLGKIKNLDTDLIIIDHLQYFTLTNPKNELQEMTEIMMSVKNIANFMNIPVILVSHLRKKDKDRGLPGQEDFFGTSNIVKIASIAITICPFYGQDNFSREIYPTFFRIVKSRTGIRPNLATLCNFDAKTGQYQTDYAVHRLVFDKPQAEPIPYNDLPRWAKNEHTQKKT